MHCVAILSTYAWYYYMYLHVLTQKIITQSSNKKIGVENVPKQVLFFNSNVNGGIP